MLWLFPLYDNIRIALAMAPNLAEIQNQVYEALKN